MSNEENRTEGIIAYEKETGKQAMVDGKLTDDFKAWALKNSEKLEDALKETKEEVKKETKEEVKKEEIEEIKEEIKIREDKAKKETEEKKAEDKILADKKEKEEKAKEKEKNGVYVVENNRNQFVREYTPEIHGDNRKKLAEQFAKKIKGKVVIR